MRIGSLQKSSIYLEAGMAKKHPKHMQLYYLARFCRYKREINLAIKHIDMAIFLNRRGKSKFWVNRNIIFLIEKMNILSLNKNTKELDECINVYKNFCLERKNHNISIANEFSFISSIIKRNYDSAFQFASEICCPYFSIGNYVFNKEAILTCLKNNYIEKKNKN